MNPNFIQERRDITDEEILMLLNKGTRMIDITKKYNVGRKRINRVKNTIYNDDGCSQCGECCKYLVFGACWSGKDWEEKYAAHGCYVEEGKGFVVPCVCAHLKYNEETKKHYCDIYDHRPNLCRNDYLKEHGMGSLKPKGCTRRDDV
jgi:hypothetical protein